MTIPLGSAGGLLKPGVCPKRVFDLGNHRGLGHRLEIVEMWDLSRGGDYDVRHVCHVLTHERIARAGRRRAQRATQRALRIVLDAIEQHPLRQEPPLSNEVLAWVDVRSVRIDEMQHRSKLA